VGNLPQFGEHIAWAESSAVCYANSVLGARTNREGGPSALAAALTGLTPAYGYHLDENRLPSLCVKVETALAGSQEFGALGVVIGRAIEKTGIKPVPFIQGIPSASLEELKSLCASLATYGGAALFHVQGITPEAAQLLPPRQELIVTGESIAAAIESLSDLGPDSSVANLPASAADAELDFYTLGCPHCSIQEIRRVAELLRGKHVRGTFWITTARPTKELADRLGYSRLIEDAGARIAADTCCVVAPIARRFRSVTTDSAKACFYASSKHRWKTRLLPFDQVIREALK
jgi:hypothetical protein